MLDEPKEASKTKCLYSALHRLFTVNQFISTISDMIYMHFFVWFERTLHTNSHFSHIQFVAIRTIQWVEQCSSIFKRIVLHFLKSILTQNSYSCLYCMHFKSFSFTGRFSHSSCPCWPQKYAFWKQNEFVVLLWSDWGQNAQSSVCVVVVTVLVLVPVSTFF